MSSRSTFFSESPRQLARRTIGAANPSLPLSALLPGVLWCARHLHHALLAFEASAATPRNEDEPHAQVGGVLAMRRSAKPRVPNRTHVYPHEERLQRHPSCETLVVGHGHLGINLEPSRSPVPRHCRLFGFGNTHARSPHWGRFARDWPANFPESSSPSYAAHGFIAPLTALAPLENSETVRGAVWHGVLTELWSRTILEWIVSRLQVSPARTLIGGSIVRDDPREASLF
ncbi:hypothetical protein B0H14DRAFT_3525521 [Mycena olivaceomarginata]|nr:hypothetical protein B0H14DRAFT_3525521 [Mycena olivaceomarginata]